MKFTKTIHTLQQLQDYPKESIGLGEILAIIIDVLDDSRLELGKTFSDMQVNEDAVRRWMAINHALFEVKVEAVAHKMSERQVGRLKELSVKQKKKDEELRRLAQEIEELEIKNNLLEQELKEVECLYQKKDTKKKESEEKQQTIKQIQIEIDEMSYLEPKLLDETMQKVQEKKNEINALKERLEETKREMELETYQFHTLQNELLEQNVQLEELKNKVRMTQEMKTNLLRQKEENEEEGEKIKKEIAVIGEEIEQRNRNRNEVENELAIKKAYVAELNEKIQERNDMIAQLELQKRQLESEYNEVDVLCTNKRSEKELLERKINEQGKILEQLKKDISNYKEVFSSSKFKEQEKSISNMKEVIKLYEGVVQDLFGRDIPISYLSRETMEDIKQKRGLLENQLNQLNSIVNTLNSDYISVIKEVEEEVNKYAL